MTSKDGEILDRSTHIIVEQVAAMRDMVNAFSDYARAPDMEISTFDIKILIDEVIDLYKEQEARIKILLSVNSIIEDFDADPGRIRQMMHNLIRNSIEAIGVREAGYIKINVNLLEIKQTEMIEILVEDNGG